MKNTNFNTTAVQAKTSTIDSIVDVICSEDAISRQNLAEKSGVSSSTVAKIVKALLDSGSVIEKHSLEPKGATSLIHLSNKICTAVLDLSSSVYSFNLVYNGEAHLRYTHRYDANLDFQDNLYEFISRALATLRLKKDVSMNICVLYSDTLHSRREINSYLPNQLDKEFIDATLYDVCRRIPSDYISKSQAVCDAVKFNVINGTGGLGGVSFLSLGNTLSAFNVSDHCVITPCKIQNLFIQDNITAEEFIKNCFTKDQFQILLEKSVNFVDTAFSAGAVILESDTFDISGVSIRSLSRNYAAAKLLLPILYPVYSGGDKAGITVLSAAKRSESNFVKSLIQHIK